MKNTILRSYLKKILRSEAFISVIVVFVLALGIIGTSYALYMDVDTDTDYQLVEVGDLRIDFDHNENSDNPNDYNKIDLENVTPMEDDIAITQENNIFSFRIYNSGTYDVDYKIKLVTADGNQIDTQYINYQICKDNATCNNINTLSNSSDSVIRTGQIKTINENETNSDYYFLRVWINNSYPEELWTSDNNLVLRIMIEASNTSERSLAYNILKNAKSGIEGRSVFTEPEDLPTTPAVSSSGENERILSYTEDDLGISYYFRGNVNDNYVNFAGMCWRIVRIAGDGSIKLTLESHNPCSESMTNDFSIGAADWGYKIENGNYIGDYKNSTTGMKNKLNTWLNEIEEVNGEQVRKNITTTAEKWLKIEEWCLDNEEKTYNYTTFAELTTNVSENHTLGKNFYYDKGRKLWGKYITPSATLKCNGKTDSSKIGTLTVDEVLFAGGVAGTPNTNYYLQNNDYWWTLSRSEFYNSYDQPFCVGSNGGLFRNYRVDNNVNVDVRPAVSLVSGVVITDGEGTLEKPYVID